MRLKFLQEVNESEGRAVFYVVGAGGQENVAKIKRLCSLFAYFGGIVTFLIDPTLDGL